MAFGMEASACILAATNVLIAGGLLSLPRPSCRLERGLIGSGDLVLVCLEARPDFALAMFIPGTELGNVVLARSGAHVS